ncbi:unnamed protein product, partial [Prorocentrum cordatum]
MVREASFGGAVISSPSVLRDKGISDHAALEVTMQARNQRPTEEPPFQPSVFERPDSATTRERPAGNGNEELKRKSPRLRFLRFEELIDEASRITMTTVLTANLDGIQSQLFLA